jgi:hypothetical protein
MKTWDVRIKEKVDRTEVKREKARRLPLSIYTSLPHHADDSELILWVPGQTAPSHARLPTGNANACRLLFS